MSAIDPIEMVSLRDGSRVEVRELPWTKALEFMARLSEHAQQIVGPLTAELATLEQRRPFPPSLRTRDNPKWEEYLGEQALWDEQRKQVVGRVLLGQIHQIVTSSGSLAAFLIEHACPKLDPDRRENLGAADALRLLESAIGLTLNEEILARGKAVAARVMTAFTGAAASKTGPT